LSYSYGYKTLSKTKIPVSKGGIVCTHKFAAHTNSIKTKQDPSIQLLPEFLNN